MAEFIVYRDERKLSKTFNEVAAYLESRRDLSVKSAHGRTATGGGHFVIETTENVARSLGRRDIPGWLVGPNYTGGAA